MSPDRQEGAADTGLGKTAGTATLLTIGTRGLQIAAGIAVSIVTARALAPAGRGEYFIVVTLARTIAQFSSLGQQSSNTYLVARDQSLFPALAANSFWVSLVICGGASLVTVAAMYAGEAVWGPPPPSLWMAALLAPISLYYMLGTNLFVGIRRFGSFNAFELASASLLLLAMTLTALAGAGPSGFVSASVVGWSLVVAALGRVLWLHGARSFRFRMDLMQSSLRYSTKAYLATLAGFLLLRGNVFILSGIKGPEQVGYYSIATQVADVIAVLPQSAALVLFPNLVREGLNGFAAMLRALMIVGGLLAAACVTVALSAGPLLDIAFGTAFDPATAVLMHLLPGVFFAGTTAIVSQYLSAIGFPRAQVGIWFVGFVIVMVLSWLLIPRYDARGAALALSITHLVVFALLLILAFSIHKQASPRAPLPPA